MLAAFASPGATSFRFIVGELIDSTVHSSLTRETATIEAVESRSISSQVETIGDIDSEVRIVSGLQTIENELVCTVG